MKTVKYIIKSIISAAVLNVLLRILFGLYSVFGAPVILLAVALGLISALYLSVCGNGAYIAGAMLHILLVTSFYILFDVTDIFRLLPSDSADFFAKFACQGDGRVNLLWCILFIMPIYFFSFVLSSGIISSVKDKRKHLIEDRANSFDNYGDSEPPIVRHGKTLRK